MIFRARLSINMVIIPSTNDKHMYIHQSIEDKSNKDREKITWERGEEGIMRRLQKIRFLMNRNTPTLFNNLMRNVQQKH